MAIKFYKVSEEYGCFSNFSKHSFMINNIFYRTAEHYFQSNKFIGTRYEEEILKVKTAIEAARMGRNRNYPLRDDWEDIKNDVMKKAVLEKFRTHNDIRGILILTGNENIIEATIDDYYWGCGANGTGKNMLGKILMEVRDELS
jgi:N-glycosidase YbiA